MMPQKSRQHGQWRSSCVLGPPPNHHRLEGGCPPGVGSSGFWSSTDCQPTKRSGTWIVAFCENPVLTQDLTPPISPMVYPVMKSFAGLPSTPGDLGPRVDAEELDSISPLAEALTEELLAAVFSMGLAGLWGLLEGQKPRSSLPSSCPVVDQLVRILSRNSWT